MFLIFLGLFLISSCLAENETDYCAINKNHILCGANESLRIGNEIIHITPKNKAEREAFLHNINRFRDDVAANRFYMGGSNLPPAGNMLKLEWCDICEKAALNSLRNCGFNDNRNCCNCMNTGVMDLFPTHTTFNYSNLNKAKVSLQKAFKDFYDYFEKNLTDFEYNCVKNVQESCFSGAPGFFASLFNARQAKIGCAYVQCAVKNESMTIGYFQCFTNLDLHLDVIGKKLYSSAKAATECSKTSENYTNLCICTDSNGCIIKPAKLSPNCTKRNDSLTTLPPTTKNSGTKPVEVEETVDLVSPAANESGSVTPATNQSGAVTSPAIQSGTVTPPKIPFDAVTPPIPFGAVTQGEYPPAQAAQDLKPPTKERSTTTRTTKKISGLGGGGDASGVKNLEDGDNFDFMFIIIIIWFLFIY
ncbi:UNVERIFIED_CONTAM: hypothetical protein RMT77_013868 [Armadillidium vulgare]